MCRLLFSFFFSPFLFLFLPPLWERGGYLTREARRRVDESGCSSVSLPDFAGGDLQDMELENLRHCCRSDQLAEAWQKLPVPKRLAGQRSGVALAQYGSVHGTRALLPTRRVSPLSSALATKIVCRTCDATGTIYQLHVHKTKQSILCSFSSTPPG